MRVLVTGASSALLGGVAAALASRGDVVVCLQRRPAELSGDVSSSVRQVLADVRDADAVADAAAGCDAIVHGAARVGIVGSWDEFRSVNVGGTEAVLGAARRRGVGSVVYVSSPSVAHGGDPIVGRGADPAVTGRRRAHYAESKAIAEQVALDANGADLAVVAIRPHLVWGPGDRQLVGRIVERARAGRLALVAGGTALVDTTYLDNAIAAHVAALDALNAGPDAPCAGRPYVIANGEPRTIRELASRICEAAGVPFEPRDVAFRSALAAGAVVERVWPRLRDDEPPITRFLAEQLGTAHWFDPRPARDDLAWRPHVSLDEGFRRLAASWAARAI